MGEIEFPETNDRVPTGDEEIELVGERGLGLIKLGVLGEDESEGELGDEEN